MQRIFRLKFNIKIRYSLSSPIPFLITFVHSFTKKLSAMNKLSPLQIGYICILYSPNTCIEIVSYCMYGTLNKKVFHGSLENAVV